MKLSPDKTHAELHVSGTVDAKELDDLISHLAELRSNMTPPVSEKRPHPQSNPGVQVTMEDAPAMMAASLRDGRTRIWARSAGFGWLAFNLQVEDARLLRDWFVANVDGDSTLFGDQGGQAH